MIEKEKGEDHDKVRVEDMGQPIVVKEKKGSKMVISGRKQYGHKRKKVSKKEREGEYK
jgi:hypothetical protein